MPSRGQRGGVDTERGAAPIDMRVQVDEAGHDDQATDVLDLGASEFRANSSDPPILEADIHHRVDTLRWIDNSAPSQNQIKLHKNHLSGMESTRLSLNSLHDRLRRQSPSD